MLSGKKRIRLQPTEQPEICLQASVAFKVTRHASVQRILLLTQLVTMEAVKHTSAGNTPWGTLMMSDWQSTGVERGQLLTIMRNQFGQQTPFGWWSNLKLIKSLKLTLSHMISPLPALQCSPGWFSRCKLFVIGCSSSSWNAWLFC